LAIPSEYHVYKYTPEERLSHYDNDIKVKELKHQERRAVPPLNNTHHDQ
jgi:hypothetical protein